MTVAKSGTADGQCRVERMANERGEVAVMCGRGGGSQHLFGQKSGTYRESAAEA